MLNQIRCVESRSNRFTMGNLYPVHFKLESSVFPTIYVTTDDRGSDAEVTLNDTILIGVFEEV